MCISTSRAEFSGTVIATWEFINPDGNHALISNVAPPAGLTRSYDRTKTGLILPQQQLADHFGDNAANIWHAVAYKNSIQANPGPNAMLLLLFPEQPIQDSDIIVLEKGQPDFLDDMLGSMSRGSKSAFGSFGASARIIQKGDYTVVLAEEPGCIPGSLQGVRFDRRPNVPRDIFDYLQGLKVKPTVALCCFNGATEARTITFKFKPKYPVYRTRT